MDNKELQKKVWTNLEKSQKKAAKYKDNVVTTFSIISEENADLYVAVIDGKLSVEPYHYDDFFKFGCEIEASAETIDKLFSGELAFDKALADGLAVVKGGNVAKFKALECLVPAKKAAAKAPEKKTAAKAPAKKETSAKPAEKKVAPAAKPVAKAEEKKVAPAAKPVAKAEEKKAAPAAKPVAKAEEKKVAPAAKPVVKAEEKKPTASAKNTSKK